MSAAEGAPAVGQTLRRIAQELREHPERWTQGAMARDEALAALPTARSQGACRWCSVGLLHRDLPLSDAVRAWEVLDDLVIHGDEPFTELAKFNDAPGRTVAEVADLFDAAATRAELQP